MRPPGRVPWASERNHPQFPKTEGAREGANPQCCASQGRPVAPALLHLPCVRRASVPCRGHAHQLRHSAGPSDRRQSSSAASIGSLSRPSRLLPSARAPARGRARVGPSGVVPSQRVPEPMSEWGKWSASRRWCRRIGACLVHTCDLYSNMFGLPGARLAGVPVRIGSRREVLTRARRGSSCAGQRAAYRLAHPIVANSAAAAAQLVSEGVPERKVRLIPNGVDTAASPPPRRAGRSAGS